MKTNRFIAIMFLAALAAGCSKDDTFIESGQTPLRIFASTIENNGSKVAFDPSGEGTVPFASSWIDNELVKLNGVVYKIAKFTEDNKTYYGLKDINEDTLIMPLGDDMSALYPGASFGDNEVEVNDTSIILHRLGIHFLDGNIQSMAFPMVATATANSQALLFNHLSGGMRITMRKSEGSVNVASLKMVAQSTTAEQNLGDGGVTARWAVQGPSVPTGNVGTNPDDVDVKYISEMNFTFKSGSNNYVTVSPDAVSFCVPVTITPIKRLVLTGYDSDGIEIFHVSKTFDSNIDVTRNRMYTVPEIVF